MQHAQAGPSLQAGLQPPAAALASLLASSIAVQPAYGSLGAPVDLQQAPSGAADLPPLAAAGLQRQASVPRPASPSKHQGLARMLSLPADQQAAAAAAAAVPGEDTGRSAGKRRRTGAAAANPKAAAAPKPPASAEEQERKRQVCGSKGLPPGIGLHAQRVAGAGAASGARRQAAHGARPPVPLPALPAGPPGQEPPDGRRVPVGGWVLGAAWELDAHGTTPARGATAVAAVAPRPPPRRTPGRPFERRRCPPIPCTAHPVQAAPPGPHCHAGDARGGAGGGEPAAAAPAVGRRRRRCRPRRRRRRRRQGLRAGGCCDLGAAPPALVLACRCCWWRVMLRITSVKFTDQTQC